MPELEDSSSACFDRLVEELTLREAMTRLPEHHRQVLELAYFDDLTQDAIGARLGIPPGTVKSRTFNALKTLRGVLGTEAVL